MSLSLNKQLAYLRLARSAHIGPVTYQRLMRVYGDPDAALAALPDLSRRGGSKRVIKPFALSKAKQEYAATEKLGGQYLFWGEAGYPAMLAPLPDAPPVLAAHGHTHLLVKPMVAIVGARNASAAARKITAMLAEPLSEMDMVIVSGLARGVDGTAHETSLATGTIAVIGNGAAHSYPKENADLQQRIVEQGLLLAENPPDTAPQANLFPRRNRIIAGLSLGVIVVEAARRSGSLITARLAGEYGREVFAVPGSPLDARCLGSNNLLREGAVLTETVEDVMVELRPVMERQNMSAREPAPFIEKRRPPEITDTERQAIIDLLGPVPMRIDDLVEQSAAPVQVVHLVLLELDLSGRLTQEPGGLISLI